MAASKDYYIAVDLVTLGSQYYRNSDFDFTSLIPSDSDLQDLENYEKYSSGYPKLQNADNIRRMPPTVIDKSISITVYPSTFCEQLHLASPSSSPASSLCTLAYAGCCIKTMLSSSEESNSTTENARKRKCNWSDESCKESEVKSTLILNGREMHEVFKVSNMTRSEFMSLPDGYEKIIRKDAKSPVILKIINSAGLSPKRIDIRVYYLNNQGMLKPGKFGLILWGYKQLKQLKLAHSAVATQIQTVSEYVRTCIAVTRDLANRFLAFVHYLNQTNMFSPQHDKH